MCFRDHVAGFRAPSGAQLEEGPNKRLCSAINGGRGMTSLVDQSSRKIVTVAKLQLECFYHQGCIVVVSFRMYLIEMFVANIKDRSVGR